MLLKKNQFLIFLVTSLYLVGFALYYLLSANYEFIIYVGVVLFFFIVILITNAKVQYSNFTLWGLSIWALMHMSGGSLYFYGTRLYEVMLVTISESYQIIKYDQFVHFFGFAFTTILFYEIIKPLLKKPHNGWIRLSIVLIMAGTGAGALNEMVEFIVTVVAASTGVGGYVNTSLDLISNLFGAIAAMLFIIWREKKKS